MSADGYTSGMRACWWACGVDESIIRDADCPTSEQARFAALGLFILLASGGALVAGHMIAAQVLLPGGGGGLREVLRHLLSFPFAVFFALFVLNLLRLSVGLAGRRSDRIDPLSLDALRAAAILLITGVLAIAVAAPLQVAVVERDVQAEILAQRQIETLERARATDADQFDSDAPLSAAERLERHAVPPSASGLFEKVSFAYSTNRLFCWSILAALWLLFAMPPVIRLLTDRGAYDFLVIHRNRVLLAAAGIEPEAFTLHSPDGTPRYVDAFHAARAAHDARLAEVLADRRRDSSALSGRLRRAAAEGDDA